jgi:hypothetical protein
VNPCAGPQLQSLDQGANIGDIHDQRSGASTARDQIGTLRGIKSECLRAIVGIRTKSTGIDPTAVLLPSIFD